MVSWSWVTESEELVATGGFVTGDFLVVGEVVDLFCEGGRRKGRNEDELKVRRRRVEIE